jgi:hypothetical protein
MIGRIHRDPAEFLRALNSYSPRLRDAAARPAFRSEENGRK